MADQTMTLADALAIIHQYRGLAYPNRTQAHVLEVAKSTIATGAEQAMKAASQGLCVTCGGDGWHRPQHGYLSGPCQSCNGLGMAHA